MKKKLLMFIALLLVGKVTSAQSTILGNGLSGAATTPAEFLGSSSVHDVIFKSSGTERMRILNSNGYIGIGTLTGTGISVPNRKLVISNAGADGIELHPFGTYTQIISYKRTVPTGYLPLVLQDPSGGNVGVGMTNPLNKLVIQTSASNDGINVIQTGSSSPFLKISNTYGGGHTWGLLSTGAASSDGTGNFTISDYGVGGTGSLTTRLFISGTSGNVGIGTTNPTGLLTVNGKTLIGDPGLSGFMGIATANNYLLYVQQGILTEKVKVAVATSTDWSDYVFASDYTLKSINDLESYVKENKHLPNIPSAEEMVKEGNDLGKMDAKLLEKIEELTLYLIDQNRKIENMQKELNALKSK